MENNYLTYVIVCFFGAIIGYYLKYLLEIRYSRRIDAINRKRQACEEIIDLLDIFIAQRNNEASREKFDRFYKAYSLLWLWASDSVIKKASEFLNMMGQPNLSEQNQLKARSAFIQLKIELRKELGHPKTALTEKDYSLVNLKEPNRSK